MSMAALTTTIPKQEKSEEDDMISRLPEPLLQHVLSFLPTKDAVRTSILSKTWEYLWTTIPSLTFELYSEEHMNFVDRALLLRGSTTVKMFYLVCHMKELHLDRLELELTLERWFNAVVKLDVEELSLCFNDPYSITFKLPCCLFVCASLTSLTLDLSCCFTCYSSINLSSLKHLVLQSLYFRHAKSVENLFAGCPLLETASLLKCDFQCSLRVSAPKLCKLKIIEESWHAYGGDEIMIFAPSLKSFYLESEFPIAFSLHDVASLDEAKILIGKRHSTYRKSEVYFSRLKQFLEGISKVKKLCLCCEPIEALKNHGNLQDQVPFFNNLSVLSLVNHRGWGTGLTEILQKSHYLETIRFEGGIIIQEDCKDYERILNPVPLCFLSSLKTLEIFFNDKYNNNQYQKLFMNAAKVLLNRAAVLEKLILYASCSVDQIEKDNLIKGLNELPRSSKFCQIEFVDSETKSL